MSSLHKIEPVYGMRSDQERVFVRFYFSSSFKTREMIKLIMPSNRKFRVEIKTRKHGKY